MLCSRLVDLFRLFTLCFVIVVALSFVLYFVRCRFLISVFVIVSLVVLFVSYFRYCVVSSPFSLFLSSVHLCIFIIVRYVCSCLSLSFRISFVFCLSGFVVRYRFLSFVFSFVRVLTVLYYVLHVFLLPSFYSLMSSSISSFVCMFIYYLFVCVRV